MAGFSQLYEQYAVQVYRFLLALTGEPGLAEELTQETFYQAFLHINQFESRCSVSTWLCQIGKNGYYAGTAYGVHDVDEQILSSSTYCYMFPCVPETVWKVMAEEEEAERIAFEERAAQYLTMGREEWLEKSREQFIAGMESWEAEHGRITKIRFYSAYAPAPDGDTTLHRFLGQWQLEYTFGIGGEEGGSAILRVRKGKVESINGLYWSESTVIREFWDQFRQIRYYQIPDGAE